MIVSITETDNTKRTMQGYIEQVNIDLNNSTITVQVTGLPLFRFMIKDKVQITQERTL